MFFLFFPDSRFSSTSSSSQIVVEKTVGTKTNRYGVVIFNLPFVIILVSRVVWYLTNIVSNDTNTTTFSYLIDYALMSPKNKLFLPQTS